MNQNSPALLRAIYPAAILFYALTLLYALGVEMGAFTPVEMAIRGLPVSRWLFTVLVYVALVVGVTIALRHSGGTGRLTILDAMSINRGGLGWFDALLLVGVVASVFVAWRYYDFFDRDLLPIFAITALAALVGMFRSPPWAHIRIFQRSDHGEMLPTFDELQNELGRGDQALWNTALDQLIDANPDSYLALPQNTAPPPTSTPGEELFVPVGIRPPPPQPTPSPPAQGAAAPPVPPPPP